MAVELAQKRASQGVPFEFLFIHDFLGCLSHSSSSLVPDRSTLPPPTPVVPQEDNSLNDELMKNNKNGDKNDIIQSVSSISAPEGERIEIEDDDVSIQLVSDEENAMPQTPSGKVSPDRTASANASLMPSSSPIRPFMSGSASPGSPDRLSSIHQFLLEDVDLLKENRQRGSYDSLNEVEKTWRLNAASGGDILESSDEG